MMGHYDRDTVNSVGLFPRRLPFTASNTAVRTFRHAVSLDERRAKFKANLWNRPKPASTSSDPSTTAKPKTKKNNSSAGKLREFEKHYQKPRDTPTDIEEVWFAGCHCGSYTLSLLVGPDSIILTSLSLSRYRRGLSR
jgi:uncharacterized protein (DUF2235 family)